MNAVEFYLYFRHMNDKVGRSARTITWTILEGETSKDVINRFIEHIKALEVEGDFLTLTSINDEKNLYIKADEIMMIEATPCEVKVIGA